MRMTFPKITRLDNPAAPNSFGIADSPLGYILAAWEETVLVALKILPAGADKDIKGVIEDFGWDAKTKRDDKRAAAFVNGTLFKNGTWTGVFPEDLMIGFHGSNFQFNTMKTMIKVPSGKTATYKDLATAANSPGAARAIGTICAKNPVALVVPCHRILAANGGLGGYGYGTAMKRQLLEWEAK